MKREFLENIKVGDAPLTKEAVDLIMGEYGKGIEAEKAKFADYDNLKKQLDEANSTIKSYKDMDIDGIKKSAADWETKYTEAVKAHEAEKTEREFNDRVTAAITNAKGKNNKAIMALLDIETLKASKNQDADIKAAVEACQKENEYLFGGETPPPYAGGTGTGNTGGKYTPEIAAIRAAAGLKND